MLHIPCTNTSANVIDLYCLFVFYNQDKNKKECVNDVHKRVTVRTKLLGETTNQLSSGRR